MSAVNPIIIEKLREMVCSDPDIPSEVEGLIKRLLDIESISSGGTEGISKLYDQILTQYIENPKIIQWSDKYED